LSQGELYTFVTSKEAKGKKRSLVAIINGTESGKITQVLAKLPEEKRNGVTEITMDMARNMESASRNSFPKSKLVTDRFHVVRLVLDALQHLRIKYRWEAIDDENRLIEKAKKEGRKYEFEVLPNGDTLKQLLARSRYLLYKLEGNWTVTQQHRAALLFGKFPLLLKAYNLAAKFRYVYQENEIQPACKRILEWIQEAKIFEVDTFNTAAKSIEYNLENILNFFSNRSTNANAESFNSKIKQFRANQRGVRDVKFFLFRLEKLFS
jgi:transposase